MKTVIIGQQTFNVYDQGSGDFVVFIHGFPLDHSMWQPHLDQFAAEYRVIAPDLRGLGKSPSEDKLISMQQHADDLIKLLTQMGITGPVNWCGLSMGGYVIWQILEHHPEWVKKLILCDTKITADSSEAVEVRKNTAAKVLNEGTDFLVKSMIPKLVCETTIKQKPDVVNLIKAMIEQAPSQGVAACSLGMAQRPDMSHLLKTIKQPVLVICGEADAITPANDMEAMAKQIPNARFEKIPQAGHMAPMEQLEIVSKIMASFLKSN